MRIDEQHYLVPWLEAFERVFHTRPEIKPFRGPEGAPDDLFTMTFPLVFDPPENVGQTGHFKHIPAMVEHVRRLGYDWNSDGRILTIPTPSTFNAILPLLVGTDAGYRAALMPEETPRVSLGPWLDSYLDGILPLHVAGRGIYERPMLHMQKDLTDEGVSFFALRWHLTALVHDMSVHLLNYHLVPRHAALELGAMIRKAFPERAVAWRQVGNMAPPTLTEFFDYDINNYCYAVWCRCRGPADFAPIFMREQNYSQLLAALEVRMDETRAGKGDNIVPYSGDMPPLQRMTFSVETEKQN